MVKYDWTKLSPEELGFVDTWNEPEYTNNIVKSTTFPIKEAVRLITEQRKFNKKTQFSDVKPIKLMLEKMSILEKTEKIETCINLLFAQFHIQMLDYGSIKLESESSLRKIVYLLNSYWVPQDIFDEVYDAFIQKIKYEQKKLR